MTANDMPMSSSDSTKTKTAIDTINTTLGSTTMGTTATTVTGAIAEHESDISTLNSKITNVTYAAYIEPTFENGIADIPITQNVFGAGKIYDPICQLSTNTASTLTIRGCDMRASNTLLRICLNDNSINQTLGVFVHYSVN
jgi:hypothetical protein